MNKKGLIVIALLVAVAIIGVGGKMYMDKKEEAEKIEAERMSVKALKNTFADIKSVEFERSNYNKMTGDYSMIVIMTNIDGYSVRFDYLFAASYPDEIGGWKVVDEENVQRKGCTDHKVDVIYSDGSKGGV